MSHSSIRWSVVVNWVFGSPPTDHPFRHRLDAENRSHPFHPFRVREVLFAPAISHSRILRIGVDLIRARTTSPVRFNSAGSEPLWLVNLEDSYCYREEFDKHTDGSICQSTELNGCQDGREVVAWWLRSNHLGVGRNIITTHNFMFRLKLLLTTAQPPTCAVEGSDRQIAPSRRLP